MKFTIAFASALAVCGTFVSAEVTAPTQVAFEDGAIATSLTGQAGDPVAGAEVMVSRGLGNCLACHEVTALKDQPFHGEVGPMLDGAGSRWSEAELRGLVVNAKQMFDGTVMPAFYRTTGFNRPGDGYTGKAAQGEIAPILTAQQVEDVVAYLMTLKDE